MQKPKLYWFRRDLRLHDQPVLQQLFRENKPFVAFYCLDERPFLTNRWGFQGITAIRLQFLLDNLRSLETNLALAGVELVIRHGQVVRELTNYLTENGIEEVYAESLPGSWEQADESALVKAVGTKQFRVHFHHKNTLIDRYQLPFQLENLPAIFTDFRKKVESSCVPRTVGETVKSPWPQRLLASPALNVTDFGFPDPNRDERNPFRFEAGEAAAKTRLQDYFWHKKAISQYKQTRNGLLGADFSSRFSPWLALGVLSPRYIYTELNKFEAAHGANESTYWLYFELLWRDYFQWVAFKAGDTLFQSGGIRRRPQPTNYNQTVFKRWCKGETGQPFIDANMRELQATGWMSNRGRQNVASFLVHDLKQDWRAGAAWFEAHLLDYDPASNYGNWNYIAGIGNDPRENRRFNPEKQAAQYDPYGAYQRLWLS